MVLYGCRLFDLKGKSWLCFASSLGFREVSWFGFGTEDQLQGHLGCVIVLCFGYISCSIMTVTWLMVWIMQWYGTFRLFVFHGFWYFLNKLPSDGQDDYHCFL